MANRYELSDEVKQKYTPIVQEFVNQLESVGSEGSKNMKLDLSDTDLNPHTLQTLLESMGYTEEDRDTNGWQLDYWITMVKSGFKTLYIKGTAITFELLLVEK